MLLAWYHHTIKSLDGWIGGRSRTFGAIRTLSVRFSVSEMRSAGKALASSLCRRERSSFFFTVGECDGCCQSPLLMGFVAGCYSF